MFLTFKLGGPWRTNSDPVAFFTYLYWRWFSQRYQLCSGLSTAQLSNFSLLFTGVLQTTCHGFANPCERGKLEFLCAMWLYKWLQENRMVDSNLWV